MPARQPHHEADTRPPPGRVRTQVALRALDHCRARATCAPPLLLLFRNRSWIHHNALQAHWEASSKLCVVRHNLIQGCVAPRWNTDEGGQKVPS